MIGANVSFYICFYYVFCQAGLWPSEAQVPRLSFSPHPKINVGCKHQCNFKAFMKVACPTKRANLRPELLCVEPTASLPPEQNQHLVRVLGFGETVSLSGFSLKLYFNFEFLNQSEAKVTKMSKYRWFVMHLLRGPLRPS